MNCFFLHLDMLYLIYQWDSDSCGCFVRLLFPNQPNAVEQVVTRGNPLVSS